MKTTQKKFSELVKKQKLLVSDNLAEFKKIVLLNVNFAYLITV